MRRRGRNTVVFALILIAIGVWFMATELFPALKGSLLSSLAWPALLILVGILLLARDLFRRQG